MRRQAGEELKLESTQQIRAEVGSELPAGCSFQKLPALAERGGLGATGSPSPCMGRLVRPSPSPGLRGRGSRLDGSQVCLGAGKAEVVKDYLLLEHEDAHDEGEGDQVRGDPHETVLIWGLWTDGPRPASVTASPHQAPD